MSKRKKKLTILTAADLELSDKERYELIKMAFLVYKANTTSKLHYCLQTIDAIIHYDPNQTIKELNK